MKFTRDETEQLIHSAAEKAAGTMEENGLDPKAANRLAEKIEATIREFLAQA